jgi:peroxiredoxin Q/BCP
MTSLVRFLCVGAISGAHMLMPLAIAVAFDSSGADDPPAESAKPLSPARPGTVTTPAGSTTPPAVTTSEPTTSSAPTKPAGGAIPEVGSAASDFSLTNSEGKQTKLKDYRGKWVVLYFYPKDFTSGCTLEAKNFESDLAKYSKLNAIVLGVSVDSPESHKEFCIKERLTFKLLSDPEAKISHLYGSVMEYEGAKMSARNTFIINPDGKIAKVFTKVNPTAHSAEVLAALGELEKSQSKPAEDAGRSY